MCSQNFRLLGPITFLPDNYSLIFFVLLSNKSWYNSICSCESFLFLTSNWKNSNFIDLQHCSVHLSSLILISSLKYTNMCMLASYQWDAMLDGNVKPWMTVHSLRSQLTRKLHTHRDVCIGMCVIESVSQMELKRVCVHTVFMNGWKCAREISSSFAASSLAQATKIL